MSDINLVLLKESAKEPFSVCQTGVGSNAIFCDGCLYRIHKKIQWHLEPPCSMILISWRLIPWNSTAYYSKDSELGEG